MQERAGACLASSAGVGRRVGLDTVEDRVDIHERCGVEDRRDVEHASRIEQVALPRVHTWLCALAQRPKFSSQLCNQPGLGRYRTPASG